MEQQPEHWIKFFGFKPGCPDLQGEVTVRLHQPIRLFEEPNYDGWGNGETDFNVIRAVAKKRLKRLLGIHPCNTLKGWSIAPHDWSDSVDALSALEEI